MSGIMCEAHPGMPVAFVLVMPWHDPTHKFNYICYQRDYRGTPWRARKAYIRLRPMLPKRKHIRLRDYDYSLEGAYFITICTKEKKNFFCRDMPVNVPVWDPKTMLSPIGEMVTQCFNNIPTHFRHAVLDEFIVMPNHIHCILVLGYDVGSNHGITSSMSNQFGKPIPGSISVIINHAKAAVTKWCNKNGHEYFGWQSKFHDHVIRNAASYEKIQNYIINNPDNWNDDVMYT